MAKIIGNTTASATSYIDQFDEINAKLDEINAKIDGEAVLPELQEKTATENGMVTPDEGYDGLSKVKVAIPEYDGETVKLISFWVYGLDGEAYTQLQAEEGMTWEEYIASSYNSYGFAAYNLDGSMIVSFRPDGGDYVNAQDAFVEVTEQIIADYKYEKSGI